jgi:hypothetical protein
MCIGGLVVGEILFLKIVVVRSHFILAFLLGFSGISRQFLVVVVDFVSGAYLVGVIRTQFEVVGSEVMQLLVVKFGLFHVLPCAV